MKLRKETHCPILLESFPSSLAEVQPRSSWESFSPTGTDTPKHPWPAVAGCKDQEAWR